MASGTLSCLCCLPMHPPPNRGCCPWPARLALKSDAVKMPARIRWVRDCCRSCWKGCACCPLHLQQQPCQARAGVYNDDPSETDADDEHDDTGLPAVEHALPPPMGSNSRDMNSCFVCFVCRDQNLQSPRCDPAACSAQHGLHQESDSRAVWSACGLHWEGRRTSGTSSRNKVSRA